MAEENITAAQTGEPAAETAAPPTEPVHTHEPPKLKEPEPKPEAKPEPETKPAEEPPKEGKTAEKPPEVALLEGKVYALSAGVKPETVDDVLTLAKADVKEGVTLEQAIDGVLKRYPIFNGAAPPSITSSVSTGNDEAKASDDEFVKKIMGIK